MDEPAPRRRTSSASELIQPAVERLESLHNLLETRRKESETLNTELTRTLQLLRDMINGFDEKVETLAAEILAMGQMQNRQQLHLDRLTEETERLSRLPARAHADDGAARSARR